MLRLAQWINKWSLSLYLYILKESTKQYTAIQISLRSWGVALDYQNEEVKGFMQIKYPELISSTLEDSFPLRGTGTYSAEYWMDNYEVKIK